MWIRNDTHEPDVSHSSKSRAEPRSNKITPGNVNRFLLARVNENLARPHVPSIWKRDKLLTSDLHDFRYRLRDIHRYSRPVKDSDDGGRGEW